MKIDRISAIIDNTNTKRTSEFYNLSNIVINTQSHTDTPTYYTNIYNTYINIYSAVRFYPSRDPSTSLGLRSYCVTKLVFLSNFTNCF